MCCSEFYVYFKSPRTVESHGELAQKWPVGQQTPRNYRSPPTHPPPLSFSSRLLFPQFVDGVGGWGGGAGTRKANIKHAGWISAYKSQHDSSLCIQ